MARFVLALAALAFLLLPPSPMRAQAPAGDTWVSVATGMVNARARHQRFDVSNTNGRSKAVRLMVRQGGITIERVVVTYSNGQVHYGDFEKPVTLQSGQSTNPIDQRSEERFIDAVDIAYSVAGRTRAPIQIEIQALQSAKGRQVARAEKASPTMTVGAPGGTTAETGETSRPRTRSLSPSRSVSPQQIGRAHV